MFWYIYFTRLKHLIFKNERSMFYNSWMYCCLWNRAWEFGIISGNSCSAPSHCNICSSPPPRGQIRPWALDIAMVARASCSQHYGKETRGRRPATVPTTIYRGHRHNTRMSRQARSSSAHNCRRHRQSCADGRHRHNLCWRLGRRYRFFFANYNKKFLIRIM
jgi:hypothetical protein